MSKQNNTKNEYEFPQPAKKQTFSQMIYDPQDGTIFGRTSKSWGQLFIFYLIFYIILAALFAICMQGLLASVNDKQPKWKLEDSLIGTNPGLGFRPLSEETERGSLIQFDGRKEAESNYWIELIDTFLADYNNTEGSNLKHCDFNQSGNSSNICLVNVNDFGSCSPGNSYGYKSRGPCIFLKLNKIYGWKPEYYDDPTDLPKDMPLQLQQHINATNPLQRQQIWVTCNGHHSKDKEYFKNVEYYPRQGFPSFYYPYTNQKGYLSPLVAVHFKNPPPNAMLDVECRAWAKNIIYSGSARDRKGSVTFQLMVD